MKTNQIVVAAPGAKTTKRNLSITSFFLLLLMCLSTTILWAQVQSPSGILAVMNMDVANASVFDERASGDLVRMEIVKSKQYEVLDKYDMSDILKKEGLSQSCFGKTCLINAAKVLGVNKMLTGSIDQFGEKIVISLRLIDADAGHIEASNIIEFLNLPTDFPKMVEVSVKDLLGIENDPILLNYLVNNDKMMAGKVVNKQNLSGPRMGVAYITGFQGQRLQDPIDQGGFDAYPVLTQFGYQFETTYLGAGNFQALFETVFMVSGLEQGMFIPSVIIMNGFRENKLGLEVSFGPSFSLRRKTKGFYTKDTDGKLNWHMNREWNPETFGPRDNYKTIENLDSRGSVSIVPGWVWAAGKTFHSGRLNIPVNLFIAPRKEGWWIGTSLGFNIRTK